ncbi:hypothetical protein ILUMI_22409 [Ignelater luminosus]|uniref:PiggyBac transposable element-derived protein domain-containing protein n=1 Tax=Ignelater luminosus TaxID=2038154 RepID=A0A8K0CAQ1_IGNLU|nr:hypothetical protein ILUMI_22409 [Ignelater luminosus]
MHHRECRISTLLFFSSYWTRPLNLNELIEELKNLHDEQLPNDIVIFPPEDTDEDSGDEDLVQISNLPGSQLRAEAITNLTRSTISDSSKDEDDIPLSHFAKNIPRLVGQLPSTKKEAESQLMQSLETDLDKFSKVRPLIDAMNQRFIDSAPQEECHSLDESMVPYYGRHGAKQFIRGKLIRWGYKFWMSITRLDYVEWFDSYQGSSTTIQGFQYLLRYLFRQFFTTLQLLEELKSKGQKGTGTIRENRLGKDCKVMVSNTLKKKERGSFDYCTAEENEIVVCKWNDSNAVSITSNSNPVFPTMQVKRYSEKDKKRVLVDQPNIIKEYNENMGGVDRADENISHYRVSIRGKK